MLMVKIYDPKFMKVDIIKIGMLTKKMFLSNLFKVINVNILMCKARILKLHDVN